jgi:serine/threonine-protein phosphatase 5
VHSQHTCPLIVGGRGLETLVVLACWKLALPGAVSLLRGNHESATCTLMYGFKGELVAKYGKAHWRVGG